jgi:hypothetical protein
LLRLEPQKAAAIAVRVEWTIRNHARRRPLQHRDYTTATLARDATRLEPLVSFFYVLFFVLFYYTNIYFRSKLRWQRQLQHQQQR